jgi:hypothetical protein
MAGRIPKHVLALVALGYVLLVAATVVAMLAMRSGVLQRDAGAAQQDWNTWRNEAAKQDGEHGPVQRSVPRSGEPPALVLMRDYFAATTIGLLVPVSALYGFIAWIVCGVAYSPTPVSSAEEVR